MSLHMKKKALDALLDHTPSKPPFNLGTRLHGRSFSEIEPETYKAHPDLEVHLSPPQSSRRSSRISKKSTGKSRSKNSARASSRSHSEDTYPHSRSRALANVGEHEVYQLPLISPHLALMAAKDATRRPQTLEEQQQDKTAERIQRLKNMRYSFSVDDEVEEGDDKVMFHVPRSGLLVEHYSRNRKTCVTDLIKTRKIPKEKIDQVAAKQKCLKNRLSHANIDFIVSCMNTKESLHQLALVNRAFARSVETYFDDFCRKITFADSVREQLEEAQSRFQAIPESYFSALQRGAVVPDRVKFAIHLATYVLLRNPSLESSSTFDANAAMRHFFVLMEDGIPTLVKSMIEFNPDDLPMSTVQTLRRCIENALPTFRCETLDDLHRDLETFSRHAHSICYWVMALINSRVFSAEGTLPYDLPC